MSLAPSFRRPGGALHPGRQAPMDIRFCSVCNESIPDADFDAGRAITAGGRSQHVACALERATRMGSARSWWTSLLALYAAAATTFLLVAWLGRDKVPTEATFDTPETEAILGKLDSMNKAGLLNPFPVTDGSRRIRAVAHSGVDRYRAVVVTPSGRRVLLDGSIAPAN